MHSTCYFFSTGFKFYVVTRSYTQVAHSYDCGLAKLYQRYIFSCVLRSLFLLLCFHLCVAKWENLRMGQAIHHAWKYAGNVATLIIDGIIYLFICLFIYSFIYLLIHLFVCLFIYLFILY